MTDTHNAATQWRDISSAPKDGTRILTWGCLHDDGGVDMGETPTWRESWWTEYGWYSPVLGGHEPIMWMPGPPPPTV
jgi:hypothetical protein